VVIAYDLNDVSALYYVLELMSVYVLDARPGKRINACRIIEEIRIDVHCGDQRAISIKIAFQSGGQSRGVSGGRGGFGGHIFPALD
jgi:hypothetical protein